jgi:hypothetical protein
VLPELMQTGPKKKKKKKSTCKVQPIAGHEGPEGLQKYSSTLPLTSVLDGVND